MSSKIPAIIASIGKDLKLFLLKNRIRNKNIKPRFGVFPKTENGIKKLV